VDRATDDAPRVVAPLVEHLFREEAGRLTSLLTRLLGPAQLALAEDVVQEAFIAALGHWPRTGVPSNPSAWLLQVARRKALDALRRDRLLAAREPEIGAELDAAVEAASAAGPETGDDPFADDQLRMILLCCHPVVSAESRVALALKLVSGLSVGEIARALLADERAVAQRLVRAKRALREANVSFDLPEGAALAARLDAVHDVLYLMFNEGHTAHEGASLLRRDLCDEALRLTTRLLHDARTASPATHALAALFEFHASMREWARTACRCDWRSRIARDGTGRGSRADSRISRRPHAGTASRPSTRRRGSPRCTRSRPRGRQPTGRASSTRMTRCSRSRPHPWRPSTAWWLCIRPQERSARGGNCARSCATPR
jgi:RNA polymerase sigma factor (sigma-70 family)